MVGKQVTTKQRAYLKSLAMNLETIFQIGKGGLTDESVRQISNALEARELIKCKVLETSPVPAKELSMDLAKQTESECVQVIGSKIVLYRKSKKKSKIELP
ncbi:MAG: ribosome assembly RNA-binding protein YhbY [Clostridiales bacterium]|nr:ribosome assembly RNA-binding protein YhbY [Clostridiales bacterium]